VWRNKDAILADDLESAGDCRKLVHFLLYGQKVVGVAGHHCALCFWRPFDSGAEFRHRPIHLHTFLGVLLQKTSLIRRLWEGWKRVGRKIGDFQARVLLTLIYAIFVLPFGVAVRLFGDPLRLRRSSLQWLDHAQDKMDMQWARRQW
jgi:hypothetical protein